MTLRFGTDGVRGVANAELTPELALALGRAAARVLGGPFVVGTDTRRSGPMLQAAFTAGLAAEGSDAALLGVVPTPVVGFGSELRGWSGAVVSASHNSFEDNGIKLFAPGGTKLGDDVEAAVEHEMERLLADPDERGRATGEDVGHIAGDNTGIISEYVEHLVDVVDGRGLDGLRVVLDCANGAASYLAPLVFERLGAEVIVINDHPDGCNINDRCGAGHPEVLRLEVVDVDADLGLAFDGDADRLIAVDHLGAAVDGDHVIAIGALDRHARGLLVNDTVVTTVMANLGFRLSMEAAGIHVVETAVGDRYVLEALTEGGHVLGGEQSGHVIFRDLATTGDGLLTGVVLADVVRRSGRSLADLAASAMTRLPQVLLNVPLARPEPTILERLAPQVAAAAQELGDRGRVLVRPSGTEPLIRVMVEAPTHAQADDVAARLAAAVRDLSR
jgi:phosphoglucosamine mutase